MDVYVSRNGGQEGPYTADRILEMIRNRDVLPADLVWYEELANWQPASTIFDFSDQPPPAVPAGAGNASSQPGPAAPAPPAPSSRGASFAAVPAARLGGGSGAGSTASRFVLAGRGARLGAAIIDSMMAFVCALPGGILAMGLSISAKGEVALGVVVMILCLVGLAIYQIMLLGREGQTIGKRAMKIAIVTADTEANPGFAKAVMIRAVLVAVLQSIPGPGSLFALADILAIFRQDRRCIHDLMAGTKVVALGSRDGGPLGLPASR